MNIYISTRTQVCIKLYIWRDTDIHIYTYISKHYILNHESSMLNPKSQTLTKTLHSKLCIYTHTHRER